MANSQLIFITGGARSGKSSFAESYATKAIAAKKQGALYYLATSRPTDDEMKERIKRHRQLRQKSGQQWHTIECPNDLLTASHLFRRGDVVLLDCLTILLTNELFRGDFEESAWQQQKFQQEVVQSILDGIRQIQGGEITLLVVSNEVLNHPMHDQPLVQAYSRLLGKLHQQIVDMASEAYMVETGIPILMKGVPADEGNYGARYGI
ncbi:bifunctional adenosylcobinamide kinase/adenosylcobinamide-phosphate guanylyltransferase [Virgibacillus ihumii]|uniref:bifunctional adenosylcobinamide kinase/adenosylcobinamide-phosphate guanylyltransferase n=1 Tax=Virgibacillus ihumii TaxID=2686091 RepID=UPI00157DDF9E|nr:bifunctional adenosylcobinamide kinase/adenosylcobinamide-phosphate guanylyltransferase [Virgibacillus ihumii]